MCNMGSKKSQDDEKHLKRPLCGRVRFRDTHSPGRAIHPCTPRVDMMNVSTESWCNIPLSMWVNDTDDV